MIGPLLTYCLKSKSSIPRYGFNGKEKDDEHSQGKYNFGARIYDGRLGRWLKLDLLHKNYPSLSPYNFVSNNPIIYIDPDGKSISVANQFSKDAFDSSVERHFGDRSAPGTRRRNRTFTDIILASYTQTSYDGTVLGPGDARNAPGGSLYQNINTNSRAYRRAFRRLSPAQQVVANGLVAAINDEQETVLDIVPQEVVNNFDGITFTNPNTQVAASKISEADNKSGAKSEKLGLTIEGGMRTSTQPVGPDVLADAPAVVDLDPRTTQAQADAIIRNVIAFKEHSLNIEKTYQNIDDIESSKRGMSVDLELSREVQTRALNNLNQRLVDETQNQNRIPEQRQRP